MQLPWAIAGTRPGCISDYWQARFWNTKGAKGHEKRETAALFRVFREFFACFVFQNPLRKLAKILKYTPRSSGFDRPDRRWYNWPRHLTIAPARRYSQMSRASFFAMIDQARERNRDASPEEIEA
jgi:hypothetical protein